MGKKVITLIISLLVICLITFAGPFAFLLTENIIVLRIVNILIYLLIGIVAVVAMKLTGIKVDLDFKNAKSYLIGLVMAIALSFFIGVLPALLGTSLVGPHVPFAPDILIMDFLFYVIAVGPVEELVFRVYVQETFISFFEKHKWIGVIIASFLFGLWHMINGTLFQFLITFGIGLVFGFAKYFLKNCKYLGVATAHGLYDFSLTLVAMFII